MEIKYEIPLYEIYKSKTIITVCPHYDITEIARLYLKMNFKGKL